jgi:hypothetical protein
VTFLPQLNKLVIGSLLFSRTFVVKFAIGGYKLSLEYDLQTVFGGLRNNDPVINKIKTRI